MSKQQKSLCRGSAVNGGDGDDAAVAAAAAATTRRNGGGRGGTGGVGGGAVGGAGVGARVPMPSDTEQRPQLLSRHMGSSRFTTNVFSMLFPTLAVRSLVCIG